MTAKQAHAYVEDPRTSISRGIPLSEESGLGELTLPGFLREVTTRHAQREALVQWHEGDAAERWSYAQLWQRSVEVANALIACGLGKGERVGVLMTNRAEFLPSVFGTALAGGVAAPLSTFSTPDELEFLLAASACSVLLLERHVLKKDFSAILTEPGTEAEGQSHPLSWRPRAEPSLARTGHSGKTGQRGNASFR